MKTYVPLLYKYYNPMNLLFHPPTSLQLSQHKNFLQAFFKVCSTWKLLYYLWPYGKQSHPPSKTNKTKSDFLLVTKKFQFELIPISFNKKTTLFHYFQIPNFSFFLPWENQAHFSSPIHHQLFCTFLSSLDHPICSTSPNSLFPFIYYTTNFIASFHQTSFKHSKKPQQRFKFLPFFFYLQAQNHCKTFLSINPLMGTLKFHQFLLPFLLLQLIQICSVFVQSKQSNLSNLSPTVMFALKAQQIPRGSIRRPASKLPFHHNVSLTVSLLAGTPPQPVTMVLDTGSELSWLHCKKEPNLNSLFDPLHSTSYSQIPCTSPTCKTRTRDFTIPVSCDPKKLCHVSVSYADTSSMEGTLGMDNFKMGGSSMPGIFFGCMDQGFSSSDTESRTTGLLGMNRGSLSFVSQMNYPQFSYCISGQDASGVLLFGEANFAWLKPRSYTPLVKISSPLPYFDRVAYSVKFEGIKVGGRLLSLPNSILEPDHTGAGQTMVDSGTQFSFLLGPVYTALRNEFMVQTKGKLRDLGDPNYVFQGVMDLCYRVPLSQKGYPVLPTVTLMFEGAEMSVSGERLLYRVPGEVRGSDGVHCFTFGNADLLGVEAYIIGHHHQQNMWMEFDLVQSRVGLAEVRCDLASQKLGLGL